MNVANPQKVGIENVRDEVLLGSKLLTRKNSSFIHFGELEICMVRKKNPGDDPVFSFYSHFIVQAFLTG